MSNEGVDSTETPGESQLSYLTSSDGSIHESCKDTREVKLDSDTIMSSDSCDEEPTIREQPTPAIQPTVVVEPPHCTPMLLPNDRREPFPDDQIYFAYRRHNGLSSVGKSRDSGLSLLEQQPKSDSVYHIPLPMGESVATQLLDITDIRASVFLSWASAPMLSWIVLYTPFFTELKWASDRNDENTTPLSTSGKIISFPIDHEPLTSYQEKIPSLLDTKLKELRAVVAPYLFYGALEKEDTWRKALYTPMSLLKSNPAVDSSLALLSSSGAHCERIGVEFAIGCSDIKFQVRQSRVGLCAQVQMRELSLWMTPINLTGLRAPLRDDKKWPWYENNGKESEFQHRKNDTSTNLLKHLGRVSGDNTLEIQIPLHANDIETEEITVVEGDVAGSEGGRRGIHQVKGYLCLETIDLALTSSDYTNVHMISCHNITDVPQRLSSLYGEEIRAITDNLQNDAHGVSERSTIGTDFKLDLSHIQISFARARGDLFMTSIAKGVYVENDNIVDAFGTQILNIDVKHLSIVQPADSSYVLCHLFNNHIDVDEDITPSSLKCGGGNNMAHLRVAVHSFPLPQEYANQSSSRITNYVKTIARSRHDDDSQVALGTGTQMVSVLDRFELTLHPVILNAPKSLIQEMTLYLGSCAKSPQSPAHMQGDRAGDTIKLDKLSKSRGFPSQSPGVAFAEQYYSRGTKRSEPEAVGPQLIDEITNHYLYLNYFRVNPLRIVLTTDHTINLNAVDFMVRGFTMQGKLIQREGAALAIGTTYAKTLLKQAGSRLLSAKLRVFKDKFRGPQQESNGSNSVNFETESTSRNVESNDGHSAWASSILSTNKRDIRSMLRRSHTDEKKKE